MDSMMPHSLQTPESSSASVSASVDARHVFVYGTLRRGGRNDIARFAPQPVFVGTGVIAGTLYDLGTYPGAVLGGDGRIRGEVYRITADVERELDLLEEVADDDTGEYIKRELRVQVGEAPLNCLVYEIQPARVAGLPVIGTGDWLRKA